MGNYPFSPDFTIINLTKASPQSISIHKFDPCTSVYYPSRNIFFLLLKKKKITWYPININILF